MRYMETCSSMLATPLLFFLEFISEMYINKESFTLIEQCNDFTDINVNVLERQNKPLFPRATDTPYADSTGNYSTCISNNILYEIISFLYLSRNSNFLNICFSLMRGNNIFVLIFYNSYVELRMVTALKPSIVWKEWNSVPLTIKNGNMLQNSKTVV